MNIVVERGKVIAFSELPNYSIALDGYVQGPQIDTLRRRYSFDHHSGCLRYCTMATCMQASTAVRGGLDPEPYTIYANDVDVDVCAAIWCLKNPDRCKEPQAIKLINAIGTADMHAGSISINGMTKAVEWIAEPETSSKRNHDYNKISDDGLMVILEAILRRIDLYVDGEASAEIAKMHQKSSEYKILRNENDWVMVQTQDPHCFSSLYQSGFDRLVVVRPQPDGTNVVTIAKRSDFIDHFPMEAFIEKLNVLEPGWGGGSTIMGSPRNHDGSGTKLSLDEIADVLNGSIKQTGSE